MDQKNGLKEHTERLDRKGTLEGQTVNADRKDGQKNGGPEREDRKGGPKGGTEMSDVERWMDEPMVRTMDEPSDHQTIRPIDNGLKDGPTDGLTQPFIEM